MRVLAAMTLLFVASCTFDYGPLEGTAGQGEGGVGDEAGARDGRDAIVDRPLISDAPGDGAVDALADMVADADLGPVDAPGAAEVSADVPGIGVEDAAPEEDVPTGGVGGSGSTDTGGAGGSTSLGTGGSVGGGTSETGGIVSSGGTGGVVGGTTLTTSTAGTGGRGGTAGTGGAGGALTTGGVGGTVVDGGLDGNVVDGALDRAVADASVDGNGGEAGDAAEIVCTPGTAMCEGNATCSCNAAGTGCSSVALDCGATMICNLGACVTPVVDTLPFDSTSTAFNSLATVNQMKVNFYYVTTARTLLRIEQYLSPSAAGYPLTWVIYRSAVQAGVTTYNFLAKVKSTTAATEAGYQSSPPLNIALQAGAAYGIGVYWEANSTTYWYHAVAAGFPMPVSFGTLQNGLSPATLGAATVTSSTSSTLYYPQRLSTM
jgi:hypothetical protein